MTECCCGTSDFYPFVSGELKRAEPETFALLAEIWGPLPADIGLSTSRVYLQLDGLTPEVAASIAINGAHAGGFIGKPFRLAVTRFLKSGANTIRIEPFSPRSAELVVY